MIKFKKTGSGKKQRGSALILVLGVLALLLISATTFIFTANASRDIASVNADTTKAQVLARSGLDYAFALFHTWAVARGTPSSPAHPYQMYFDIPDFGVGASGDWAAIWQSPAIWNGTHYTDGLKDAYHYNVGFDYTPSSQTGAYRTNLMSWHLINNGGNIVGRTTYLVVDESGKLDVNGALSFEEPYFDRNGNGSYDSGEFYIDINGNDSYDSSAVDEGDEKNSTGSSPQFIDLKGWFTKESWNGLISGGNANAFRTRSQGTVKRWLSWRQMFAANYGGTPLFVSAPAISTLLGAKNAIFPRSYDKEAYSDLDTTGDRQDFDRFSFGQFDWGGYAPADSDSDGVIDLAGDVNRKIWDDTDGNYTTSISWLAKLKATTDVDGNGTAGEASDDTALRNQVAANIIDYCDSDSDATNDYGSGDTYCGLEKVPYINEVSFEFTYNVYDTSSPLDGVADEGELTVTATVELVNIYGDPIDITDSDVKVTATVDIEQDDGSNTTAPQTLEFTTTAGAVTVAKNSYHTVTLNLTNPTEIKLTNAASLASFDDLKITGVNVVFGDPATTLYDYAKISKATSNTVSVPASLMTVGKAYASVEVKDSRCNTVDSQWTWSKDTTSGDEMVTATIGSMGAVNSVSDPLSGDDKETVSDPAAGISTAYIRNAPMQSLWELGAIHRGEPWRTINLVKYNDGSSDGNYANGDAILLDQCSTGAAKVVHGRLNMNSSLDKAWYPVLRTVGSIGKGYDYSAGGASLTNADITAITAGIKGFTHPAAKKNPGKSSRGQIVDVGALQNRSGQVTNATQEEIIGRIAGLLNARTNYLTIIVTAQALKDLAALGTTPDSMSNRPSSWVKLQDGKWVDVLAESKLVAVVRRDAYTDTYTIEDLRHVE